MAVFRVGSEDAEFFEKQFTPIFSAKDIMNIDNYNCYLKMLAKGVPIKPFNIKTFAPEEGDSSKRESLKQLSYLKYGRPREEVEDEIMKKYLKPKPETFSAKDLNNFL